MADSDNARRQNGFNAKLVSFATFVFGALGLLFLFWSKSGNIVMMCALSLFGGGFFLGFLFGIPRTDQKPKKSSSENGSNDEDSSQSVNTNLEQISDWLTKIIVGVGLVELKKVYEYFQRATIFIAGGIGINDSAQTQPLAAAVIIYFMVLGFLSGYILTRILLAGAFSSAERADRQSFNLMDKVDIASIGSQIGSDKNKPIDKPTEKAASQLAKIALKDLSGTAEDYAAWAKAQMIKKNYQEAIKGYALAALQFPDDVKLLLEYADALEEAGRTKEDVRAKLLLAYKKISDRTPPKLRGQVYNALMYISLYLPDPKGFSDTIRYGEEYVANPKGAISGSIWVNLAAAYGQQYTYYSGLGQNNPESGGVDLEIVRNNAFNAAQKALATDKYWLETLRMMMLKNYTDPNTGKPKDPEENDFECFANDKEFRILLKLTE